MSETKNKRFGELPQYVPRFGELLKEGISSVANRQLINEREVKQRIGEAQTFPK